MGHLDCAASDDSMLAAFCATDEASAWLASYKNKAKTDIRGRGVARECYGGSSYDGHVTGKGDNGTSDC